MTIVSALTLALVSGGSQSPLPDDWNLDSNYSVRGAAAFARQILDRGNPDDIRRAEEVLDAVLACQECREGSAPEDLRSGIVVCHA